MLVGDTSAQLSAKRREQMLTKLNNPVLSSLDKEEFPELASNYFVMGLNTVLNYDQKRPTRYINTKKLASSFFGVLLLGESKGDSGAAEDNIVPRFYRPVPGLQSSTLSF